MEYSSLVPVAVIAAGKDIVMMGGIGFDGPALFFDQIMGGTDEVTLKRILRTAIDTDSLLPPAPSAD